MTGYSYIALPPDSSGKKLFTHEHIVSNTVVQIQGIHQTDPRNPENIQYIDAQGQAYTRFAEGSPTIDAIGNLRVGEQKIIGGYEYTNSDMGDLFTDTTNNGGSFTWDFDSSEVRLTVTSANNSSAIRTSNRFHYYQPGNGVFTAFTLAHGDSGKVGNIRRWGYFNEIDGIYWELNGTTLNLVLRSSTTGAVEEIRIPQSLWNGDKMDGTGVSKEILDITKFNYYWIDFVWQGAGAIRCGIKISNGSRIVTHTFNTPNSLLHAFMSSGSQPVRWENFNTQGTGGISEIRTTCTTVYNSAGTNYTFWSLCDIEAVNKTITINTPILSMKPNTFIPGTSYYNRTGIYPESYSIYVKGGPAKISLIDDATLTNATWAILNSTGFVKGDINASSLTGGEHIKTYYLNEGCHVIHMEDLYETNDEGYHVLADGTGAYTFTLAGTALTANSTTVSATLNYRELR